MLVLVAGDAAPRGLFSFACMRAHIHTHIRHEGDERERGVAVVQRERHSCVAEPLGGVKTSCLLANTDSLHS